MLNNSNMNDTVPTILKYKPPHEDRMESPALLGELPRAVHCHVPYQYDFCCKQYCQLLDVRGSMHYSIIYKENPTRCNSVSKFYFIFI